MEFPMLTFIQFIKETMYPTLTAYSPQASGSKTRKMEGGIESSRRGPDGKALVRTLNDVRSGQSGHVTLAGNPKEYGKSYSIPGSMRFTPTDVSVGPGGPRSKLRPGENTQVLPDTNVFNQGKKTVVPNTFTGNVHDTGGAFKKAPIGRYDVATNIGEPEPSLNRQPLNNNKVPFKVARNLDEKKYDETRKAIKKATKNHSAHSEAKSEFRKKLRDKLNENLIQAAKTWARRHNPKRLAKDAEKAKEIALKRKSPNSVRRALNLKAAEDARRVGNDPDTKARIRKAANHRLRVAPSGYATGNPNFAIAADAIRENRAAAISESRDGVRVSAPGYNSRNHYHIRFGPGHFAQGIQDAYDASNVSSHMLRRTIEGKTKGIDRAPLVKKGGRSYEEHELSSHEKLMKRLSGLAKRHGVAIKHEDYSKHNWNALEDRFHSHEKNPHFRSNLSEPAREINEMTGKGALKHWLVRNEVGNRISRKISAEEEDKFEPNKKLVSRLKKLKTRLENR